MSSASSQLASGGPEVTAGERGLPVHSSVCEWPVRHAARHRSFQAARPGLAWQDAPEGSPPREITFTQPSHAWLSRCGCGSEAGTSRFDEEQQNRAPSGLTAPRDRLYQLSEQFRYLLLFVSLPNCDVYSRDQIDVVVDEELS